MTMAKLTVIAIVIVCSKLGMVEHSYNEGTSRDTKMITVMKTCMQLTILSIIRKIMLSMMVINKAHNNDGDNSSWYLFTYSHLVCPVLQAYNAFLFQRQQPFIPSKRAHCIRWLIDSTIVQKICTYINISTENKREI